MEYFVGDFKTESEQKFCCVVMYVLMISLSYITLSEESEPDRFPSFNRRYFLYCCTLFIIHSSIFFRFNLFK